VIEYKKSFLKGKKKYYYIVFMLPAILGLIFSVGCVATALMSGSWREV
jgi:hypothetical protein